jgi:hypothetical protein
MHFITHVGLCLYVSNFICIVNKSYTSTKTSFCLDNTFILCRRLQNRKYMLAQRTKSQQDCFRRLEQISKRNTKLSIFCLMIGIRSGMKNKTKISIDHRTNFFASRLSLCGGWLYEVPNLDLYKCQ